ncbi:MAG: hypothetical protein RL021_1800 [Bacteroidota bacterium]|jgi:hypothetical protein
MKGRFTKVFSLLLLPVLLAATNGIVVLVHTCLSSESMEVTLFHRTGCCSDQPCGPTKADRHDESASIEGQCCTLKSDFVKVQLCQPSVHFAVNFTSCYAVPAFSFGSYRPLSALAEGPFFPDDASPPDRASSPDYIFSVNQLII